MAHRKSIKQSVAALAVVAPVLLAACGDKDRDTAQRAGARRSRGVPSGDFGGGREHPGLRRRRHRPLRVGRTRSHPGALQPGGERRGPVVRVRHRRRRPGHRPSRPRPPGAGPEGLGRDRRQRLPLRAEMLAATEEGKWVSYVYQNPENGRIRLGRFQRPGTQERMGGAARRTAVRLGLVHRRRRVHQVPGGHSRRRVP